MPGESEPPARGEVDGLGRGSKFAPNRRCNHRQHPVQVAHDIVVPEAQNSPSVSLKPLIANRIGLALRMLPTIDFDHKAVWKAGEVQHITSNRVLASEFDVAEWFGMQRSPQGALGISRVVAQSAGEGALFGAQAEHWTRFEIWRVSTPSPALPLPGGGSQTGESDQVDRFGLISKSSSSSSAARRARRRL